ncbi:DNA cytosine methyltransferase [Campylobacter volucris]|uniref:DNA cytosine methyltransferase n=1 Tax=Campylobacter volucris TaxID=1031542 RepID=UPI00189C87AC|nr:DNA cytosine methyltransferase [Campylobacter volucris]MBF7041842.1 DNA cytosine methyltransferase [Campylobacter volucris]
MRVADIFCGAGGLSYGFAQNPFFSIIFANDIDKDCAQSYIVNHPNVFVCNKDINELCEKELKEFGKIDLLLGGPPCQSYSTLGKRKMDDKAKLFKQYIRILNILNPKMFVFENVVGLLSMQKGELFKTICNEFQKIGYKVFFEILNAVDFGVPQIRERVILIGIKNSFSTVDFVFPKTTVKQQVTLKDALDDLPIIQSGENGNNKKYRFEANNDFLKFIRQSDILEEHSSPKNNTKLIKIMQTLKDGEGKDDLPLELRPKSGYKNTYAKMWWNKPSPTITRNFSTPSSSRCIHPRDSRALSIREGARLQSFPDNYIFCGSDTSKRLQIGNAVPPLLSIALAKAIEQFVRNQGKNNV